MPSSSDTHLQAKNRAYIRAKRMLEKSGQYLVNDPGGVKGTTKKNLRVAQSYLCSVLPITAANTQYVFNTLDNVVNAGNTGILPIERRLKLQDVFFTSSLGFYLTVLNWGGFNSSSHFQLFTYPPGGFGGPIPQLPDLAAIMGVWSGTLEVKTNGEVVTPYWRLLDHSVINQTQTNYANTPLNPIWDQIDFASDGKVITEPNWILNGGNNNLYTVTYGSDWGQVLGGANSGSSINLGIVMLWDGWLAQNASSIMDNASAA